MSLVEFNNVYKRYKTGEIVINAVDGISFKVEEGEFAIESVRPVQAKQPF